MTKSSLWKELPPPVLHSGKVFTFSGYKFRAYCSHIKNDNDVRLILYHHFNDFLNKKSIMAYAVTYDDINEIDNNEDDFKLEDNEEEDGITSPINKKNEDKELDEKDDANTSALFNKDEKSKWLEFELDNLPSYYQQPGIPPKVAKKLMMCLQKMQSTNTLLLLCVWNRQKENVISQFATSSITSKQPMLEVSAENQWKYILKAVISILQDFCEVMFHINELLYLDQTVFSPVSHTHLSNQHNEAPQTLLDSTTIVPQSENSELVSTLEPHSSAFPPSTAPILSANSLALKSDPHHILVNSTPRKLTEEPSAEVISLNEKAELQNSAVNAEAFASLQTQYATISGHYRTLCEQIVAKIKSTPTTTALTKVSIAPEQTNPKALVSASTLSSLNNTHNILRTNGENTAAKNPSDFAIFLNSHLELAPAISELLYSLSNPNSIATSATILTHQVISGLAIFLQPSDRDPHQPWPSLCAMLLSPTLLERMSSLSLFSVQVRQHDIAKTLLKEMAGTSSLLDISGFESQVIKLLFDWVHLTVSALSKAHSLILNNKHGAALVNSVNSSIAASNKTTNKKENPIIDFAPLVSTQHHVVIQEEKTMQTLSALQQLVGKKK